MCILIIVCCFDVKVPVPIVIGDSYVYEARGVSRYQRYIG